MSLGRTKTLYINSRDRLSGTPSDFTMRLRDIRSLYDYDSVSLLFAHVPKSYLMIEEDVNDSFLLDEDGTEVRVVLNEGNYSFEGLREELQRATNAVSSWTYTVEKSTRLIRYIFNVSGNTAQPSFEFDTYLSDIIGFDYESTNAFSGDALTSPNAVNLQRVSILTLWSDIVDTTNQSLHEISSGSATDASQFEVVNQNPLQHSHPVVRLDTNVARFKLQNFSNGNVVGFQGLHCFFALMLYKRDKTKEYHYMRAKIKDAMNYIPPPVEGTASHHLPEHPAMTREHRPGKGVIYPDEQNNPENS